MTSFRNALLAAAAVVSVANSHIIMENPVPYSVDKIDNSPITASQFPCKLQNGFEVSQQNKMTAGSKNQVKFKGSAIHNGGTCQFSVALGQQPDGSTPFKVIKTIEGGCPGNSQGVQGFEFELPDSIPNGEQTFAWTWMPTSSGGPEYYMNCAPIEVEGGASDDSKFNELPDMLVANLPGLTDCTQTVNTILQVPNPGENVEKLDDQDLKIAPPTGNCGSSSGGGEKRSSTTQGQQPTAAPSSSPAIPNNPGIPTPSANPGIPSPSPSSSVIAIPSNPGGAFAPGASSAAGPQTTTTLITVTAAPSSAGPTASSVAPSVSPSSAPSSAPSVTAPSPAGPTAPANTAPPQQPTNGNKGTQTCTAQGSVVCNGETQFGLCNNGSVVWQAVAPGTTCQNGVIQKRAYHGRIVRRRY